MKAQQLDSRMINAPALRRRENWRQVVFSVGEARRALPYVARIAADAREAYREVQSARDELGKIATMADRHLRRKLCEQRDRAITRLNLAIDDCNAVGADLVDLPSGRLSLPALIEQRPASLLWQVGDPTNNLWPELA